jgi:hypothetical protein
MYQSLTTHNSAVQLTAPLFRNRAIMLSPWLAETWINNSDVHMVMQRTSGRSWHVLNSNAQ